MWDQLNVREPVTLCLPAFSHGDFFPRKLSSTKRRTLLDREVHGFRCKLATCKCQELHGPRKQPGRRMHGRRADFDFFVRFENTACCINARLHAGSSQLFCLLALSRSDWRVLPCCLCGLTAVCAVLCLRSKESKGIQECSPTNNILVGNYRLRRAERWENMPTVSSDKYSTAVQLYMVGGWHCCILYYCCTACHVAHSGFVGC